MSYSKSPYRNQPGVAHAGGFNSARAYGRQQQQPPQRAKSPFQQQKQMMVEEPPAPQTFIFSDLPADEKDRFMDFLLSNDVEFQYDNMDQTYVATIKIVNKPEEMQVQQNQLDQFPETEVVSGMDQMRQFQNSNLRPSDFNQQNPQHQDSVMMLQNQIQDLTKFQNRLKQFDEKPKGRASRNGAQSARGGIRTEPTFNSMASSTGGYAAAVTARGQAARETPGKKAPGAAKTRPMNTTSAAQLQVYLRPEFKNFTEALKPRNPQTIRPKRQNLLVTLRMIEEIYSHRFLVKKETVTLHESICDWLKTKYKQKNMIDQTGFDLLASTEQHRQTSAEVNLFYSFLIQTYPLKELLYYLYVRSLAEKELATMITKLPSNQDIRSVMITNKKCFKIAKMYFENVLAVSQEMEPVMDNAPEVAAENFVEICIQDARIEELFDEATNKLQLSFFLMKLLNEFKHQEVSNAVENQRMQDGGGHQVPSGFQPSPDGFRSPMGVIENQEPPATMENPPHRQMSRTGSRKQQQMMEGMDTMEQREVELLNKIMKFIVSNKVNGTISFMLNEYSDGLSKEVLDMIREEIKGAIEGKIQMLLQSAFMADENQWFSLLGIQTPNQEQQSLLEQLIGVIDTVFNTATYNENNPDESVVIDEGNLEELARILLSSQELRAEFANQVNTLTTQAKRGLETDSEAGADVQNWQRGADQP